MDMHTSADYTVSVEVAQRAGLYGYRYMTADGRVILSEADLRRVRLTPQEYITGIDARLVESKEALRLLIHDGGYKMLPDGEAVVPDEEPEGETPADENAGADPGTEETTEAEGAGEGENGNGNENETVTEKEEGGQNNG